MGNKIPGQHTRSGNKNTKDKVLKRDHYKCVYCGGYATEVDHVIPLSNRGIEGIKNMVACCTSCNMKKSKCLTAEMAARGLYILSTHGMDLSWVDKINPPKQKDNYDPNDGYSMDSRVVEYYPKRKRKWTPK